MDIRSGLGDADLMKKYGLSSKGLESAFSKLINNRILTVEEVYGQRRSGLDTVVIDDMRSLPRHYLTIAVTIYEPAYPEKKGRLRDITERGVGIIGIESRIGEVKSFVLPCRQFLKVDSIWFEAECRWVEAKRVREQWLTGFQITKISPDDLENLRDLIRLLCLR